MHDSLFQLNQESYKELKKDPALIKRSFFEDIDIIYDKKKDTIIQQQIDFDSPRTKQVMINYGFTVQDCLRRKKQDFALPGEPNEICEKRYFYHLNQLFEIKKSIIVERNKYKRLASANPFMFQQKKSLGAYIPSNPITSTNFRAKSSHARLKQPLNSDSSYLQNSPSNVEKENQFKKYLAQKFIEDDIKGKELLDRYEEKIKKAEQIRKNIIDNKVKQQQELYKQSQEKFNEFKRDQQRRQVQNFYKRFKESIEQSKEESIHYEDKFLVEKKKQIQKQHEKDRLKAEKVQKNREIKDSNQLLLIEEREKSMFYENDSQISSKHRSISEKRQSYTSKKQKADTFKQKQEEFMFQSFMERNEKKETALNSFKQNQSLKIQNKLKVKIEKEQEIKERLESLQFAQEEHRRKLEEKFKEEQRKLQKQKEELQQKIRQKMMRKSDLMEKNQSQYMEIQFAHQQKADVLMDEEKKLHNKLLKQKQLREEIEKKNIEKRRQYAIENENLNEELTHLIKMKDKDKALQKIKDLQGNSIYLSNSVQEVSQSPKNNSVMKK
ncbi:hypothetical protein TTHERM_000938919 (macronuclear) [Tetrahymena thermophila SB210]|uniref:Uncharacterized protein n=1 Tax=Tetrahymena thermophila (strain SB210) TaxID=312017 RepID=W7X4J5_TETTS|nr:hypothetical protein TTHERM_000938919 [Tetrahymena thermophila SB210]EWS72327.1 hypothetical protein TTHERM_000938919 [Tetrahymena thermophila SB210]|eukprot:XP_012655135.1 hypothetical protein TTHERM_000938919 [Tetrahymena thermophila SB210]